MAEDKKERDANNQFLTEEQAAVLELYLQKLDHLYEELKASEKLQVEIETAHLKRILSK
ncbi:hypothetical protein [Pontibacter actiniarum]|uniref:hypothetical protein n=1 Tax=Pontibacter actiniarum TaxID=323450 RepID=UPI000403F9DB|nr:hypothetical protein [Pontibacter actiniarum]